MWSLGKHLAKDFRRQGCFEAELCALADPKMTIGLFISDEVISSVNLWWQTGLEFSLVFFLGTNLFSSARELKMSLKAVPLTLTLV